MSAVAEAPARERSRPVERVREPRWRRRDRWWGAVFLAPQLLGLLVFLVGPLGFAVVLSFMRWDGLGDATWVGLENFRTQLTDPYFGRAVWNTVKIGLITVPGGLVLALLLALALHGVRGRTAYRVIYFLPVVTSSVAVSVIWQMILGGGTDGILNGTVQELFGVTLPSWLEDPTWVVPAIAVVTVWSSLGLNVVIFLAGLATIPPSLLEAARIDGAGPWQLLRSVILPMLSPTVFFTLVVSVISSFQAFDLIYVLVNPDHNEGAQTIVYKVYQQGFREFQFGLSSAAALILLLLTLAVTAVQFKAQKRFVHYES
ncbi:multiple sugar transport system permease protein [Kitasatospora gansuensis]|uniref:Multiple sugar transport system permease protein n=1 Tax=Kitasatospora gansuensis TaxID=258050 RepID=A0A7W7SJM9_9ACTN|nr:sugar ABC transporter permease [Kitasatospora gansuensis]MBB4951696.1 multiple sugar transport system permease protein [Kitasatospora gansuensis]